MKRYQPLRDKRSLLHRSKAILISGMLALSVETLAASAPVCSALFSYSKYDSKNLDLPGAPEAPWSAIPRYEHLSKGAVRLDVAAFRKAGYRIENDILIDDKTNVKIGQLKILQLKYAFQWADKEYHEILLSQKGIDREWMKEIIKEKPQAAGKGFYISTHPFDSITYGTHLTTFKVTKPLLVLEGMPSVLSSLYYHSTAKTQQLADLGVDSIRPSLNYQDSWLPIISERALGEVINGTPQDLIIGQLSDRAYPVSHIFFKESLMRLHRILDYMNEKDPTNQDLKKLTSLTTISIDQISPEFLSNLLKTPDDNVRLLTLSYMVDRTTHRPDLTQVIYDHLLPLVNVGKVAETNLLLYHWKKLTQTQKNQVSLTDYLTIQQFLSTPTADPALMHFDTEALARKIPSTDLHKVTSHLKQALSELQNPEKSLQVYQIAQDRFFKAKDPLEMLDYLKMFVGFQSRSISPIPEKLILGLSDKIPKATTPNEKLNETLLELFGVEKVSDAIEKDPSQLQKMKASAAHYLKELPKMKLSEIKTAEELLVAAERLFGIKASMRSSDSTMQFDPSHKLMKFLSNDGTALAINGNPFLQVTLHEQKNAARTKTFINTFTHLEVQHWNPTKPLPPGNRLLSNELTMELQSHRTSDPAWKTTKKYAELTEQSLTAMVEKFLNYDFTRPQAEQLNIMTTARPADHYQILRALNPFTEGNSQITHLIYQVENSKKTGQPQPLNYLQPKWDTLLVMGQVPQYQHVGALLKKWSREAKNDVELGLRAKWSQYFLNELYPQFKNMDLK